MLTPTKLDKLPEAMIQLMSELQDDILKDICRRITKANYLTPTAEWQLYKANQLRLSSAEVNRRIARQLKVRERTVKELYTEAVKEAIHEDAVIYRMAIAEQKLGEEYGEKLSSYTRSVAFSNTLEQGLKNTNGLMRNLTNSMAAATNLQLSNAMDGAYLKVISGAFTPAQAIFEAVQKLGRDGIKTVSYDSGRTDRVDVAVRRAVLTGINKTCCDMQLGLADEMGCELVEVTSHLGARPSHAEWQGKIYSMKRGHPVYPYFYDATGYGTGAGLGGWNCRHSFYPYFEGISTPANAPTFSAKENEEEYNNSQKQRALERNVRKSKRELAALDSSRTATSDPELKAKLDRKFEQKSVTLKRREEALAEHCRKTGSYPDSSRVRVDGFGKSVSQKAVWANKRYEQKNNDYDSLGKIITNIKNSRNDLKENISIFDLPDGHGDAVKNIINTAPVEVRRILQNNRIEVCNTHCIGTQHYSPNKKAIRININKLAGDPRGDYTALFHETGHRIDDILGRPSYSKAFRKALEDDFGSVVNYMGNQINSKDISQIYSAISKEFANNIKSHSISDIIGGITQNECVGRYKHLNSYWNSDKNKLGAETFAHFFEATARNDKEKLSIIINAFPNAYTMFLNMIE